METQTMKPAAAAVGCMAVIPVCSLCTTITMDRLTVSKNLTSLSCQFARNHKLHLCLCESYTKARPFLQQQKLEGHVMLKKNTKLSRPYK